MKYLIICKMECGTVNIDIDLLSKSMESIVEYLKSINLNTIELIDDYYLDFLDDRFEIEKKIVE